MLRILYLARFNAPAGGNYGRAHAAQRWVLLAERKCTWEESGKLAREWRVANPNLQLRIEWNGQHPSSVAAS